MQYIDFLYDGTTLFGFRYFDPHESYEATFYYLIGFGGNIDGVLDEQGNVVVRYIYDAWGNFAEENYAPTNGVLAALALNPFRYRGYVYDFETGFYYLQSRYYDPKTGRFISADNADVVLASSMALTDKNLFAYCDNDPVNRTDETGEFWNFIIGGVVGAVVGGVVAALNGEDTAGIIIGVLSGAASGVVAATGLGLVAQAAVSAGISAVADIANQAVDIVQDGGSIADYKIGQTLTEATLGFVTSAIGTTVGNVIDDKITKNLAKSDHLFDKHLGKAFSAGLRKETGKSASALVRQANKYLGQSDFYLNTYRGVSSVIGSGISFWNIAR